VQVDWYKEDACHAPGDQASALAAYGKMRDALNSSGCVIYNCCLSKLAFGRKGLMPHGNYWT
jgi:hypothetical protein